MGNGQWAMGGTPFPVAHPPSPFTVNGSPLTVHCSLFTVHRSDHHRPVSKLVRIDTAWRKVRCQQVADCAYPCDCALLEAALGELALHRPANRLPRGRSDAGVDAAVGDDLDAPVGEEQGDQDAGVLLGIPHAQPAEELDRGLLWRGTG